jgi:mono/diheme cytochrome c family protein
VNLKSQKGKLPFGVALYALAACIVIAVQGFRSACYYVEIKESRSRAANMVIERGRSLFLRHCADCHGDDGCGGDGPSLRGLTKTDDWLGDQIRKGVKGRMVSFEDTLTPEETAAIISFTRSLK